MSVLDIKPLFFYKKTSHYAQLNNETLIFKFVFLATAFSVKITALNLF